MEDFISSLPKGDRARVLESVVAIESLGLSAPRVQFRQIRGKLWEVKIKTPSGSYRLFYVMVASDEMVVLHGFKKKTPKAPKKEIEIAEKRMKEVIK